MAATSVFFIALIATGLHILLATGTILLAVLVAWIVASVPRRMVLGNDIDHLDEEDQERLLLAAGQARLDAGGVPIEKED